MYTSALKAEAIRLRTVERRSIPEIRAVLKIAKSTLSLWLRDHPLTETELKGRYSRNGLISSGNLSGRRQKGCDDPLESEYHKLVRAHGLGSVQVAKVSEAAVLLRLLVRGVVPYGSMFDGDEADWVVEVPGGKTYKLQVKTAFQGSLGAPVVSLRHRCSSRRGAKRYVKGSFDFLVGYDLFSDRAYVWAWDEVAHLRTAVSATNEALECWEKLFRV